MMKNVATIDVETIRDKITSDPRWVERAILALYRRQTAYEQRTLRTKDKNGRGFSKSDGHLMGSYARWLLSGKHLDEEHLKKAYVIMKKYARQLVLIVREKETAAMPVSSRIDCVLATFPRARIEEHAEGLTFEIKENLYIQVFENGRAFVARREPAGNIRVSRSMLLDAAIDHARKQVES
jgi:hypothetical protein